MSLETTINEQLKKAMLAKDEKGLRGLRAIKSAILLAKTAEGGAAGLTEEAEIKMLQKLVKQRKDSIEVFEKQGREDLASKEKEEVEVIEQFLPKQMSAEEIKLVVAEVIKESGLSGMPALGQIMGLATKKLAGKADGKTISAVVKELLGA
jgi:uncharacterized protein YqeY